MTTLRGLLALESGEVKQAEQFFHDALSVWGGERRGRRGGGLDFEARFLAEAGKNALTRAGVGAKLGAIALMIVSYEARTMTTPTDVLCAGIIVADHV